MKRLGPCSELERIWLDCLERHCGKRYSVAIDEVPTEEWNKGWMLLVGMAHKLNRPIEECVLRAAKLVCGR